MRLGWALIFSIVLSIPQNDAVKGHLFIIGGGKRPEALMKRFIALAKEHRSGKILILPMASGFPEEVGPEQVEELEKFGASEVEFRIINRKEAMEIEAADILNDLGGIFFSGGVQSRLTAVLRDTPFHLKLKEIYREGAVIGGTSAGAAVMSEIMITGDENKNPDEEHPFETIEEGNIVTNRGFGFIDSAIIDQHFIRRRRHNRLISLVLEMPRLLGIGIDESTAAIIHPDDTLEVAGEGQVILYDAEKANIALDLQERFRCRNMIMHILLEGDAYSLKNRKVINR